MVTYRSLHTRILLSRLGALILALIATMAISGRVTRQMTRAAFERMYALQLAQASDVYHKAGRPSWPHLSSD